MLDGVKLTQLSEFTVENGDVLHAMRSTDPHYEKFGEAYFSFIKYQKIKGWKFHLKMTVNIVVPVGSVKFVVFDENLEKNCEITLSRLNYFRLTIKPRHWFAFQGKADTNLILNIANIQHNESEALNKPLKDIVYEW